MDVIVIAIIIGFLAWLPFKVISMFIQNFMMFKQIELAQRIVETTLMIRVDEIRYEDKENLLLVFNASDGKFITQGTIQEVSNYIKDRFKTKNVFLVASDDSEVHLLKPAEVEPTAK